MQTLACSCVHAASASVLALAGAGTAAAHAREPRGNLVCRRAAGAEVQEGDGHGSPPTPRADGCSRRGSCDAGRQ